MQQKKGARIFQGIWENPGDIWLTASIRKQIVTVLTHQILSFFLQLAGLFCFVMICFVLFYRQEMDLKMNDFWHLHMCIYAYVSVGTREGKTKKKDLERLAKADMLYLTPHLNRPHSFWCKIWIAPTFFNAFA